MQGIVGCIDPVLLDWFTYVPMVTKQRPVEKKGTVIVVDATLADATSPLKTKEGTMSDAQSSVDRECKHVERCLINYSMALLFRFLPSCSFVIKRFSISQYNRVSVIQYRTGFNLQFAIEQQKQNSEWVSG